MSINLGVINFVSNARIQGDSRNLSCNHPVYKYTTTKICVFGNELAKQILFLRILADIWNIASRGTTILNYNSQRALLRYFIVSFVIYRLTFGCYEGRSRKEYDGRSSNWMWSRGWVNLLVLVELHEVACSLSNYL